MTPNAYLMEKYGTGELYKSAGRKDLPISARIAAAVLSMGLAEAARRDDEDSDYEDQAANEHARLMEAKSMEATLEALKVSSAKYATAVGQEMAKEALLPEAISMGKRLLSGAASGARKLAPSGAPMSPQDFLSSRGLKPIAPQRPKPQMRSQSASGATSVWAPGAQTQVGKPAGRPAPAPDTTRVTGGRPAPAPSQSGTRVTGRPARAPVSEPTKVTGRPVPAQAQRGTVTPPAQAAPAAQTQAKPSGTVVPSQGSQTPAKPTPFMSLGTKAKLVGGAALLGGGMLTSQAIGAAGQVLSRPPPGNPVYGGGYGGPRNISQYGYPAY